MLPWREGLALDMEDSLALDAARPAMAARAADGEQDERAFGKEILRVSVLRTPRISNFTDVDALAVEPGVLVRFAVSPSELADADLVILPGTRATVADLGWLRERGLTAAVADRARAGRPCSASVAATRCSAWRSTSRSSPGPGGWLAWDCCRPGRCSARTRCPARHGTLECDDFRRAFLADVAALAGRGCTPQPDTSFAAIRQARLDTLADLAADHLDQAAVDRLIEHGAPPGLPVIARASAGPVVTEGR